MIGQRQIFEHLPSKCAITAPFTSKLDDRTGETAAGCARASRKLICFGEARQRTRQSTDGADGHRIILCLVRTDQPLSWSR